MLMAGMRSVPATRVLQKLGGGREGGGGGRGRAEVDSKNLHDFETKWYLQRDKHDEGDDFRHVGGQDVSDTLLQVVEDQTAFRDALQRVGRETGKKARESAARRSSSLHTRTLTMDAKLSSMRMMSAASLATSLPAIPIAMPAKSVTEGTTVGRHRQVQ